MNAPPTSGGCYLTLSQMDNICSCWEFNPETKRIRVVAPKTKLEPYPDYETDEDETARLVAGLCNRKIPIGRNQPERRRGARSQSPLSSGGEEESKDSGYESAGRESGEGSAGDDTAPTSGRRRQGRRRKRARGDEQAGSNDEHPKQAKLNGKISNTKRKRSRSGQLDKSSRRKNKRVKRATQSTKQIAEDPTDDYVITNTDFRKWRDSFSNKRGGRKKRTRRDSADRSSSDEFSNVSSDDSRSPIRKKWRANSVIVDNPAFKRHERLKNPRKRFGSVIPVRATDLKKRRRTQRTTDNNDEFVGTGGSGNESGGLIIDEEKPISNVESFWS